METVGLILFVLALILGFFSLLFGLPGTWIILLSSVVYGWSTDFLTVSFPLLFVLALVSVIAEVLEYYLGAAGAKKFGASGKGVLASIGGGFIGAIVCAPVFFGLGALVGLFAGAVLGAFVYEWITGRDVQTSFRSGLGAFLGRVSGTAVKLLLAAGMIVAVLWEVV